MHYFQPRWHKKALHYNQGKYVLSQMSEAFSRPFPGLVVAWPTSPRKLAEETFSSLSTRGLFQRVFLERSGRRFLWPEKARENPV